MNQLVVLGSERLSMTSLHLLYRKLNISSVYFRYELILCRRYMLEILLSTVATTIFAQVFISFFNDSNVFNLSKKLWMDLIA